MIRFLSTVAAVLLMSAPAFGQSSAHPPDWQRLSFLLGNWQGDGTGRWGNFTSEVDNELMLDDYFLLGREHAVYEPQEKNPDGEIHKNWNMYGFDRDRNRWVMRQFHTEGFVNTYVLDEAASTDTELVLVTEHIDNIATLIGPGWRARMRLLPISDDEYQEIFELAPPGEEFEQFVQTRFRRR